MRLPFILLGPIFLRGWGCGQGWTSPQGPVGVVSRDLETGFGVLTLTFEVLGPGSRACWPARVLGATSSCVGPATHMVREEGPGCLLQDHDNPWAPFQGGSCVGFSMLQRIPVFQQTLHYPCPSRLCPRVSVITGPTPSGQPTARKSLPPPLPRLPPAAE